MHPTRTIARASTLCCALVACAGLAVAEKPQSGELTEANYEAWRDHVLPRTWELKFEQIGWRTSFWDAVIEAQEKDMPILLWAMNGHPLCNT